MSYPNVVDFLCDRGHEYAGGVVSGRIDEIKKSLAAWEAIADEEPLDAQERDDQRHADGVVSGLRKALVILGVEVDS
jgi:hypothetical protein